MQPSQPAWAAAGHRRDCGKPVCCCHRAGQGAAMTSFDLSAIDTPALVLDEARMRANIRRLAERLAPFDVVPRPHLKTAKSVDVARQLLAGGNGPATVSTLREAEYFAAAGGRDILYAGGIAQGRPRPGKARRDAGPALPHAP